MDKNEMSFICETANMLEAIRKENPDIFELEGAMPPDKDEVIGLINSIKRMIFLGYFEEEPLCGENNIRAGGDIEYIYKTLEKLLCTAFHMEHRDCRCRYAESIARDFVSRMPLLASAMLLDLEAAYVGDPAAKSRSEIICSYPGFLAIFIYRTAHILYEAGVPLIPRMMTEYAHSLTGIDINAGATIGRSFFIDHGTGVVIGETTVIGDNVKIYQGVTLGALSTRKGRKLGGKKRHPTIENDVTIYSGATILGGDTVIGEGSVIGGNVFITESVPKNTRVSMKAPELVYKEGRHE